MIDHDRLVATAYRLVGTTADAEDAVQEGFARWYRMTADERAEIRNPDAWLTRVVSRICLDQLGSARARRETYVGPWLPEPRPGDKQDDPAERVTLDDEVTSAMMVLLEALTPAERVAFVLHDVFGLTFDEVADVVGRTPQACRKLASNARADLRAGRVRSAAPQAHDQVVRGFLAACATGDLSALLPLLDPDVTLRSDGGGVVSSALNPVRGADRVARFMLGIRAKSATLTAHPTVVDGRTAVLLRRDGAVTGVITFDVTDVIREVWIVRNPDKLRGWV